MKVRKKDGRLEDFDKNKIIKGCKRAGASPKISSEIANVVNSESYDGISTAEIRTLVLKELERKDRKTAMEFRNFKK
jgi:transcriptional regulator NrdR family protein